MKEFLILHYGFEKPTPEDMDSWKAWFRSITARQKDRGGLRGGREITEAGTRDLAFGKNSLTGYTVIEAEDLDAAEDIARDCPIVASMRVYEIQK